MGKYSATTEHAFLQLTDRHLGVYNAWDTHYTAQLIQPLLNELDRHGLTDFYLTQVEPLQYAVLDMQRRGIPCNARARANLKRRITAELAETDKVILGADPTGELAQATPRNPNSIGSSKKLGRFLFETLGLKRAKLTDSGDPSTDQEALSRILRDLRKKDEYARPVLEALFHRSRLKTIKARYLAFDIEDGMVFPTVKMTGTKTGRFAYANPPLQQFPKECRWVFEAPPGEVFVAIDFQQLEARLLAYLSGDTVSIEVFESGGDVHRQNYMDCFGVSEWSEVASPDKARFWAKGFLYGLSYGGEAETMKLKLFCPCPKCAHLTPPTLKLSRQELRVAEDRWYARHPAVRTFHRDLEDQVRHTNSYTSPLGGKRILFQPWGKDLSREVKNLPMQGGGARLMNRSQIQLHKAGLPICLQMHDEFLFRMPEGPGRVLDQMIADACGVMESPVPEVGGVRFPVDVEVGGNWGPKGPDNPDGLTDYAP